MCTRYVAPDQAEIERHWHVGARDEWRGAGVYPALPGPFIRYVDGQPELVVGQWALIPWFADKLPLRYSTNNARTEKILDGSSKAFRDPWRKGQRCLIPAWWFDEPNWETGKNVWWSFRRADGQPWALAGLWNTWRDEQSGELVESYTMLMMNANEHPLMSRMHKPDVDPVTRVALPLNQQDKRSAISIERADWDAWLRGPIDEAQNLIRLTPVEFFDARPAERAPPKNKAGAPPAPPPPTQTDLF